MRINRRQLLRGILGAGGAVSGALVISTVAQEHPAHPLAPPEDDGVRRTPPKAMQASEQGTESEKQS